MAKEVTKHRAPAGHPIGRSDRGQITGRLKLALDLVVNEGLEPYEAAVKVGYHPRSMRLALNKRHVLTYLRRAREVLRKTASAQNIHFAIQMRARSSNAMARLGAMKFIEQDDEAEARSTAGPSAAGFVILLPAGFQPSPPEPIDVTPTVQPAEPAPAAPAIARAAPRRR
jgi:hypothetical protein